MESAQMQPCPFCGNIDLQFGTRDGVPYVDCKLCRITVDFWRTTIGDARAKWDYRAPIDTSLEQAAGQRCSRPPCEASPITEEIAQVIRDTVTLYMDKNREAFVLKEPNRLIALTDENLALRSAAVALVTAMETCHQCGTTLLVNEYPSYCEDGCSSDCDYHAEPNCSSLYDLHLALKRLVRTAAGKKE